MVIWIILVRDDSGLDEDESSESGRFWNLELYIGYIYW